MLEAFALRRNQLTQKMIDEGLMVFNGCYLDGSFQFRNDDYDLFAMYIDDIKFIQDNYQNGNEIPIRVHFNREESDYKDGTLYYWYNENIGDRGLIATKENDWAKHLYEERAELI